MMRSLKAEALKLVTTRSAYGLTAGAAAVVALTVVSSMGGAADGDRAVALNGHVIFLLSSINVGLFSLILGVRAVTDDYRTGTIAHAFLADPKRTGTIVAKAVVAAVAGSAIALASLAVLVALAVPVAAAKDVALTITGADGSAAAGFVAANALWAVIGVGLGAVVRLQVAATVGGLVWVLVVENLGTGFLGDAAAYLPGQAAYALSGALDGPRTLAVPVAAVVLLAHAGAALCAGVAAARLRDVA